MGEVNVLDYKNACKILAKFISLLVDWLPSTYEIKKSNLLCKLSSSYP